MCIELERDCLRDDPYYLSMIEGGMECATRNGYQFLINRISVHDTDSRNIFLQNLNSAQGAILCNPRKDHVFENTLQKSETPYVIIGNSKESNSKYCVDIDIEGVAFQSASYMLKRGYTHIYYMNLPEYQIQSTQRLNGFRYAYETAGEKWDDSYHDFFDVNMKECYETMNTLLDSGRKIDGIVTSNEIQAQGVITAVKEHNIAIPAKIGVLSMGGTILSTIGSPKITILDFNPFKQGYEAAKLLIDVMERKRLRPFNFILPGELVEREST